MLRRALKRKTKEISTKNEKKEDAVEEFRSRVPLGFDDEDDEERELEKVVLGDETEIVDSLQQASVKHKRRKFRGKEKPAPAWEDEDDDAKVTVKTNKRLKYLKTQKHINADAEEDVDIEQYKHQLKNEFQKVSGTAEWAKLKWEKEEEGEDEEDESDEEGSELLRRTGNYLEQSDSLPKNIIQLKACPHANKQSPAQAKLKSVEFHPSAQVILTAGLDQRLSLFQVDGKSNPKIQSIFMKNFPIHDAHFTPDGREVVMTSLLKHFFCYDMISGSVAKIPTSKGMEERSMKKFEMSPDGKLMVFIGEYGYMHLFSTKTKELIDTVKMNGSVESVAFSSDGSKMYSHGDDGEVYIWDMNSRQCVHRFTDDGCVKGTAVATSFNDQYLATGSYSGVVNIYDVNNVMTSRQPKPLKAIMNLTSPCTHLKFNPATELLATSSNYAENAIRLVHLPSTTVFQNFPDRSDAIRIPQCMDFSLHGGYFTIANHKGQALLYRVKHYKDF